MEIKRIRQFLQLEAMGGVVLMLAALAALIFANSPAADFYQSIFQTPFEIRWSNFSVVQPLLFWINEGLMTVFFLLVGLELKREFIEGEMSKPSHVLLPAMAAVGGMIVPVMIYFYFNYPNSIALKGWAVPMATDIAFALGVLSIFGKKIPVSLKIFLMALAVFDDIGAVMVIAVFHTQSLSYVSLLLACIAILILFILNRLRVMRLIPYLFVGFILWVCVLQSGIHAAMAGVLLAFMIPMTKQKRETQSPLHMLLKAMHPWNAYFVLPVFAFANAGFSLPELNLDQMASMTVLGIVAGLFLGKQLGVMLASWIMIRWKWATLPSDTSWLSFYGVAVLCGIGFTMSLFLGTLAFQAESAEYLTAVRLGVFMGSVLSGIMGSLILLQSFSKKIRRGTK